MKHDSFDLAVIGGGSAGATLAYHAARRGVRTCVLERDARDNAGAQWVNAVPDWTFDDADVARPVGPERRGYDEPFHLHIGDGEARMRITDHGLFDVDMRLLGARLLALAEAYGADVRDATRVLHVDGDEVHVETGAIRARFVVDASGLSGVRLLGPPRGVELCTAAQEVREVRDRAAAEAFFARRGVPPGETLALTAIEGGFSVLNVRLEGDTVSILTGSLAGRGFASGRRMLDRFVAQHPFVGDRIFGGARAIPIGMPREDVVRGRHAALGDAAVQVFPAHGSGVGVGMIAARALATSIAAHDDLEPYAVAVQRGVGRLCASYEVMRRFTTEVPREGLVFLARAGLLTAAQLQKGVEQRMPDVDPRLVPTFARAARERPSLCATLLESLARMAALDALYRVYPQKGASRAAWRHAARLAMEGRGRRILP